jgi:hypothetical protein
MRRRLTFLARQLLEATYQQARGRPEPGDAIVVAGAARSGTTWLMELVATLPGARLIFEPMNPGRVPEFSELSGRSFQTPYLWSPYLRAGSQYPEWRAFFRRMLTGQIRNQWTDIHRGTLFPRRYVIKLVRASLLLGYLSDTFRPRLLYLTRHPCATIVSRLKLGWEAHVEDLLAQEALVEDYLRPWLPQIEREKDALGAHALWWAVEAHVARTELAGRPHFPISFEKLCLQPQVVLEECFRWLGHPAPPGLRQKIEQPSRTSRVDVTYATTEERLMYWKRELSDSEQQRILEWAHRLGVREYSEEPLPRGD